MEALKYLVETKPTEYGGSRAANRLDFQKDWALIKTLELFENGKDFVIIYDYHDDVLVVDTESSEKMFSFYQLKTNTNSNWRIRTLTSSTKGKKGLKHSYLGKLYLHTERFPNLVKDINLVTNARFDLDLPGKKDTMSHTVVTLSQLSDSAKESIYQKLSKELGSQVNMDVFDMLYLRVDSLSVLDHKSHAVGKVNDFLRRNQIEIHPELLYKYLYGELEIKNDYEPPIDSVEDLVTQKSLDRNKVTRIIEQLTPKNTFNQHWEHFHSHLFGKISLFDLKELETSWKKCEIDRMKGLKFFHQLDEIIVGLIKKHHSGCKEYVELIEKIYAEYEELGLGYVALNKHYIQAVTLMLYSQM